MATSIPKQVDLAKKAAKMKAAAKTKAVSRPPDDDVIVPEDDIPAYMLGRGVLANPRGPPRLVDKHELLRLIPITYPTLWTMMREGRFPRARAIGGRSLWISTEIEEWIAGLPNRYLKGDPEADAVNSFHKAKKAKVA